MWGLGIEHWIIVVGVGVLLFGRHKVSSAMGDIGKALREARKIPTAIADDSKDDAS